MSKEMRFRGLVLLAVLVATSILSSCNLPGGGSSELEGTRWQLQTMAGNSLPETVVVTAEFNDGRISGSSGCNSYSAGYTVEDGVLHLEAVATTLMACLDTDVMDTEQQFLHLLDNVKDYQLSDGQLDLLDESDNVVMTFILQQ